MRTLTCAAWMLVCAATGSCAPEDKCSGELYFDSRDSLCHTCPMDATFKNGTCKCKAGYELSHARCVPTADAAVIEPPDASAQDEDSGQGGGAATGCSSYCSFASSCIGKNSLAKAALPDIVKGLHADDSAACDDNCQGVLGGDGAADPVVSCIEAGRVAAACDGVSTQQSLTAALQLVGDCCRTRKDNALCISICEPLKKNPLTSTMIDFCK